MDITPINLCIHYTKAYWYVEFDLAGFSKNFKEASRSLVYFYIGSEAKPELQLLWMRVL